MRDDGVEPTAPNGVLVLLDNDKEVARKGHELKGDQEPEHVVGGDDEHHGRHEGVKEEAGTALFARVLIKVVETVDRTGKREHRDERHEQAGQLIEQQLEMGKREEHDGVDRRDIAQHGLDTGHKRKHRGDGTDKAAGGLGGVIGLDQQNRGERTDARDGKRCDKQRHAIHCLRSLLLSRTGPGPQR